MKVALPPPIASLGFLAQLAFALLLAATSANGGVDPTLGNYPAISLPLSTNTTVTPDTAPTNTASINVSTSTNFKGKLEGNPATGVVRVTNAHPAGTYTVTVRAFGGGTSVTQTFMLTVTTPVTCLPVNFAAATSYSTTSPQTVAVGDFNGDGKQDLAVAGNGGSQSRVAIFLGNGAGSFGTATNFNAGINPTSVAVGDLNGDGNGDLAVANRGSGNNDSNVSILLGNGIGAFGTPTNFIVGGSPFSVTVADFNGDGKQDLVTTNSGNVSILLGNGAGSFGAATNYGPGSPRRLAVGDFNLDGIQDLAVTHQESDPNDFGVKVSLGNGTGGFGPPANFPTGFSPDAVAAGDFNNDGNQDLAVADGFNNNMSILLGNGAGQFSAPTRFSIAGPRAVLVGDFNGDGNQDLAVVSGGISIFLGNGAGSFGAAMTFSVGGLFPIPQDLAVGDFNGDGKQDLVSPDSNGSRVAILLRNCELPATPTPTATATPSPPATPSPTPTPPTPTPFPTPTPGVCGWVSSVLPLPISASAVSSLGGNLYSFGGTTTGNVRVANSYKFDGTTWSSIAPLPQALTGACAVTDGTSLYVLGGFNGDALNTVYRYNPGSNTYTTLTPFAATSSDHAAAYLGGKIYKFGGSFQAGGFPFARTALEIYDISSNQWTAGANYPLSGGITSVGGFALGNFIYGVGGTTGGAMPFQFIDTSLTCRYDPASNTWSNVAMADLPATRTRAAAAAYNGGAVVAGGSSNGAVLDSALFWDPVSDTWSALPNLLGRYDMNGAVLGGSFYLVGGGSSTSAFTYEIQRLTCPPAPTPTPTPGPTLTPPPTPTPTPTLTPPPTPTPTPTPSITPSKLLNIATRMRVQTGENVLIGGFIINGTDSKDVIIRGIGPSLSAFFSGVLANPTLELFQGSTMLQSNNDWKDTQRTEIEATGLQPSNDFESAIVRTLPPGSYTAIVRGLSDTTGIAVVEVYDLNQTANAKLANIATRGFVEAGDNVMIGGLIIGPGAGPSTRLVVRAIGPSLIPFGITGALQDPTVELKDGNGTTLSSNDEWEQGQPAELQKLGLAPTDPHESALVTTLVPGAYTAIVRGVGNTAGVALVEVYHVQ